MGVPPGLSTGLKKVGKVKLRTCILHHNPDNCLTTQAARYFLPTSHPPLAPKIRHLYERREHGTLWWSVTTGTLNSAWKKTVRSWCARRTRQAFRQALRERGFDLDGKKLIVDSEGCIIDRRNTLRGTVEVRMGRELLLARYTQIMQDTRTCVDYLERKSRQIG